MSHLLNLFLNSAMQSIAVLAAAVIAMAFGLAWRRKHWSQFVAATLLSSVMLVALWFVYNAEEYIYPATPHLSTPNIQWWK